MRTTVLLDHEPVPQGQVVRALLKLEGDVAAAAPRRALNLAVVLDRSGSMDGPKLRAARAAAAQLVRRLALADVVSVVAFDDEVITVAEPATGAAQADLPRRIEHIEAGGTTNLSGGWLRGRELVHGGLAAEGINRVLLLTDGQANVGITNPEQLVGLCAQARSGRIATTTIGFGADYDEQLLRAMADAGGGNTYYIETPDQAAAIFNDELEGLFGMYAQNVSVTVAVADAVTLAAVHHEYPRTSQQDGTLRLDLGDLYAREPKSLLCEFLVPAANADGSIPVATLVVTGDVITGTGVEHRTIELPISVSVADGPKVDAEVQRELLLLESARARREALFEERAGRHEAARERLANVSYALRSSAYAADAIVAEDLADVEAIQATLAEAPMSAEDQKYLYQRSYNRASGRSAKDALIRRRKPQEPEPGA